MPGYRIPTTLELAETASVIVLARVDGGIPVGPRAKDQPLTLSPVLLLKGSALPKQIQMPGWLETRAAKATRSDPAELAEANPDAFDGGCNRYVFAKGMTLLLFLNPKGGRLEALNYPFARTAEDVSAFDARWVKAVREYVAIAALPKHLRKARLAARRDVLRSKPDADSKAIAADMDRELNAPRKALREPLPPAP
ncbi:hypothetical protein [Sphingomonas sp. LT1P40]|uniref:hypothetical protein n=1 Tax=Alteristakelama amylovorans TaxID=3096166 RepID=UPI002FC95A1B